MVLIGNGERQEEAERTPESYPTEKPARALLLRKREFGLARDESSHA
jgi:hypothetical protein